jgi:PAS domain S-box-containing protein
MKNKTDELRRRAKKEIQMAKEKGHIPLGVVELVRELQVNQFELEIQNDELKQSREELSSLYRQQHELYNYTPTGYLSLDRNMIITNINDNGAKLFRLDKNKMLGRRFNRFISRDHLNKYYQTLALADDTGKTQEAELQLKREKVFFNVQMEIIPVYGKDNEKYQIITTDITGSKQTSKTVEEALQQTESIINTVHEPLVVLDADIKVISANRSFYETFKVNPAETEGKLLYDLGNQQWNIPKLRQLLKDLPESSVFEVEEIENFRTFEIRDFECPNTMCSAATKNKKFFEDEENLRFSEPQKTKFFEDFEIIHFFPTIGEKTLLLNARKIRIDNHKPLILLAIEDITGYQQMEGKLESDISKENVNEQIVELKNTIDELKRSNEELEKFAYVASHDLQEPLRTIASFTQLLEHRYKGKFDEDADEFMDYVVDAAIQMKNQIKGLLEYSRISMKGKEFQPLNIGDVLNQTIYNLKTSIKESNAKITCDELPTVMGDEDQLQRVFQNLISNAIKFKKEDESPKIHISAHQNEKNNEYVFNVSDNGIGIEEEYVERIFVIFQRLHTRDIYNGTGIGLSIVKRIIEQHGGRIWVESEAGKGSTFYFTIPCYVDMR